MGIFAHDCMVSRISVNVCPMGPGDQGSITDRVTPNTQKSVLDTPLLNPQLSNVRFKGK